MAKEKDYQEAIEHVSRNLLDSFSKPLVIEALEKQIPKKPKTIKMEFTNHEPWYPTFCPVCFEKMKMWDALIDKGTAYCRRCGQSIDWSEEEK